MEDLGTRHFIREFKNKHIGEACAILCNGPTLSDCDLEAIDCGTIGLNASWMLHKSKYHIAIDEWQLHHMMKARYFPSCLFLTDDPTTAWFGSDYAKKGHVFPVESYSPDVLRWSWNLEEGWFIHTTVAYLGLQLAVYMGYNPIYMIALDITDRGGLSKFRQHPKAGDFITPHFERNHREVMAFAAGILAGKVEVYNVSSICKARAFPKRTWEEVFSDDARKGRQERAERLRQNHQQVEADERPSDEHRVPSSRRKTGRRGRKVRKVRQARAAKADG